MIISGRVWKFGDGLRATDLLPSKYDRLGMSRQWQECAAHVLEELEPTFPSAVRPGDILIAGRNLGAGHAHYHMSAIMACRTAGLGALIGETVNTLFQRAGIDVGFPVLALAELGGLLVTGDQLHADLRNGVAKNSTTGRSVQFKPVSNIIVDILSAGGSTPWALRRVSKTA